MSDLFPDFSTRRVRTSGTEIHCEIGGRGPPLLLLHGYPQTHAMWHRIAPALAREYTVVCPDLRGYGDSGKPASDSTHTAYSKRAMAQDMVDVMRSLGLPRFCLAGHDRGGRVAHRLCVDHPEAVGQGDGVGPSSRYPDFVTIARGFGCGAGFVKDKADLTAALQEMIDYNGPYVLDVQVPYQEHVLPMIPGGMTIRDLIKE